MSPRQLTSRIIVEVQRVVSSFTPKRTETDRDQLAAFARAVLGSVDVRDVQRIPSDVLVEQFEQLLDAISTRKRRQITVCVRELDEGDGWVIETCIEDQPFLVSTFRALLAREGLELRQLLNAIVRIRRDPAGAVIGVGDGVAESVMRAEVARAADGEVKPPRELEARIESGLALAQAMVGDFEAMMGRIGEVADGLFAAAASRHGEAALELREAEALLRWLVDENYVLMSVEEYAPGGEPISTLGTSQIQVPVRDAAMLAAAAAGQGQTVRFRRSAEESPVHRAGKPGHFVVTRFGPDGEPAGACVIDGLFTYKALHTPPEQIPVIRLALREMLADREVPGSSDRGKNITNAFNSLPLEYLLSASRESAWELTDRLLRAEASGGSDVHIRVADDGRFAFAFVAMPRWQFSEELRRTVQDILRDSLAASYADYGVYIDRYDNAIVHFYLTGVGRLQTIDTEKLRAEILTHARSWNERLQEAVGELVEPERAVELLETYQDAFNEEHKRRCSVGRIRADIACLERLRSGDPLDVDLYISELGDHPGSLNLRIFSRETLSLSRQLPLIGHFGFEVIDEYSRGVKVPHLPEISMANFRLDVRTEAIGPIMGRRSEINRAMRAAFAGRIGDDRLNRLVVASELTAREVEILRAYVAYLHQFPLPFPIETVQNTMVEYAAVAQALMAWLSSRFDPEIASAEAARNAAQLLDRELLRVTDYTADRVLAAVAAVVRATVRTNAYVAKRRRGDAYAFKIAGADVPLGPSPKPFREIWVYHPDFEGVHLRGGKVARGGLRFSDRPEDFRTEIHGLMATQMVKNVLIVPMGAKGGFVLREPPTGRDALRAAGDHYYQLFIGALLSLTDNVSGGEIVTPEGILHDEGPDSYLVVAADKGTAHLSDTANAISSRKSFWLDDAFASGGSNGYDHKATGITARGAWEATKRSFREMGIDPEADVITAVGVGDMSGDVFGNGLLRSRTIKLVAAFNHLHLFIDPDPDPDASYAERKRLFEMPRSQWTDYSDAVLSDGGGVYARKTKSVDLSPKARALLSLPADGTVNGDQVVAAILRLRVDLMWMGGIGTYIKSREESNTEVGDKANDAVRVDARDVRCRVLGEGANLAITDRGRVELARQSAQNYSAFLDNSGGVDVSDHEVNIKILMSPLLSRGKVSRAQRNDLLKTCEGEVVEAVLENNRAQSRMVSYDVRRSIHDLHRYSRSLVYLAGAVPFDPEIFAMPREEELSNRAVRGLGLHKCEAAVLAAHAKMLAYRELLEDEPFPDDLVDRMVRAYFPPAIVKAAGDAVSDHLLKREIATTMIVNRIVDNAGASFFAELRASTAEPVREISLAYLTAVAAGDAEPILAELYGLEDKHRQEMVYEAMEQVQQSLEDAAYHLLDDRGRERYDVETADHVRVLLASVSDVLPPGSAQRTAERIVRWEERGLPRSLATRVVNLRYLTPALDAVRLAQRMRRPAAEVLALRLRLADAMNFAALRAALPKMAYGAPWDGPAVSALARQLDFHLHKMVRLVQGDDVEAMITRYNLDDVRDQVAQQVDATPSISALVMLDDWLRRLLPPLSTIKNSTAAAGPR